MRMKKRTKYPRKLAPAAGRPQTAKEDRPVAQACPMNEEPKEIPSVEDVALDPLPTLEELVARLRSEGYKHIQWAVHEKGHRARSRLLGKGKLAIPSDFTKHLVCLKHGNLAKVRQQTSPDRTDQGLRILDVLPCLYCTPDPVRVILRSPVTR